MSQARMIYQAVDFVDPGVLVDRELELVLPELRWVDDMLMSCHHPQTQRDMPQQAGTTREQLHTFLRTNPHGFTRGDSYGVVVPAYTFWMRLNPGWGPVVPMAGSIGLRLGSNENLELYLGHIGYHVLPPARGHHYAERACRLVLPVARCFGFKTLWITTNPDNVASRRSCERLGAVMVEVVPVPPGNLLYAQGDREKCRYRIDL